MTFPHTQNRSYPRPVSSGVSSTVTLHIRDGTLKTHFNVLDRAQRVLLQICIFKVMLCNSFALHCLYQHGEILIVLWLFIVRRYCSRTTL